MLLAYVVFFILLSSLYGFAVLKVKSTPGSVAVPVKLNDPLVLISIFIFVFIIGFRENVGVDYQNYISNIRELSVGSHSYRDIVVSFSPFSEAGAQLMYYIILNFSLPYYFIFVFYATLQIVFFYKAFDKKIFFLLPFAILFLLEMFLGSMVNIIRQFAVFIIFFYSLKFIEQRKLIPFVLVCLLGISIHKSLIFCLPLYFILNRQFFSNIKIQAIILAVVIFLKAYYYNVIFNAFTGLGALGGYQWYVDDTSSFDVVKTDSGLGFILNFALDFFLVLFSTKLMSIYKNNRFHIFYNLFFVGLVLRIFFLNIFIFNRSYLYFYTFRFLIMAFLCHYLLANKRLRILGIGLILVQILLFFLTLEKESLSPFQFVWN